MRIIAALGGFFLIVGGSHIQLAQAGVSEAADFWLSTSAAASNGPESPTIHVDVGSNVTLHVWGRPMPGKRLSNLSLNLVAIQPGVDFVDGTFIMQNDVGEAHHRFEFIHDSLANDPPGSELVSFGDGVDEPDAIRGFVGLTVSPDESIIGIAPTCHPEDANCLVAGDGQPAWLIASLELEALSVATVDLHLQIGVPGMRHATLATGDYNLNGLVDDLDYDLWKSTYCASTGKSCIVDLRADGNENFAVDAADYTVFRDNLGNDDGMLELSSLTFARFGTDPTGSLEPLHNAGPNEDGGNRGMNLPTDDPDATLNISFPISPRQASSAGSLTDSSHALVVPEPSAGWWSMMLIIAFTRRHRRCRPAGDVLVTKSEMTSGRNVFQRI